MKYTGKEIEVTCTLENDTIYITITDPDNLNLKFPFNNISEAVEFLVSEYGGTEDEAVYNCITGIVAKHFPEDIKNIIVRNAVRQWIPDELRDFVDVNCIVNYAISGELKDLIVEDKLRQSKLLII